jgi:hypothetical protein
MTKARKKKLKALLKFAMTVRDNPPRINWNRFYWQFHADTFWLAGKPVG